VGENTKIEWAHHTYNPWWGCVKVSPECDNCYAERDAIRYGFNDNSDTLFPIWGKGTPRRGFGEKHHEEPRRWNSKAAAAQKRARVFCASYADLMEDEDTTASDPANPKHAKPLSEERARLFQMVEETQWNDYLMLTKRPQNFRRFLPKEWLQNPRLNVWLGATVGLKETMWRIKKLRETPAHIRFLSMEPLLEDLGPLDLTGIHWVIAGGESGPKARPTHPEWVRSVRDQCIAAKVPFFFKQWGEWVDYFTMHRLGVWTPNSKVITLQNNGVIVDGIEVGWAANNRTLGSVPMYRLKKENTGRLLDGREWNELPEAA